MNFKEFRDFLKNAQPVMLPNCDDEQDLIYISHDGMLIRDMDTGHWLKPYISANKRPKVKLMTSEGWKEFYVCRLVAEAYLPNYKRKPCVHHIDNNPMNNNINNLLWVTASEHTQLHALLRNRRQCDYDKLVQKIKKENEGK